MSYKGVSAEVNNWLSSGATIEVIRDSNADDARTPKACYPASWQYPSYTDEQNRPSNNPRILTASVCEISHIGSGYVHAGYAYKIKPGIGTAGLPNSSKVLLNLNTPNGTRLALGSSWAAIGTFIPANATNLVPQYEINKPLSYFKNDQNQPLSFNYNSWNVSSNGEYIVAEIPYTGLVRISVETGEMLLFSTAWFNYGQGYDPTPFLAISNDGQTALMSALNGELYAYDLSGCTQKQIKAYNNVATGCSAPKDLKPLVKTKLANFTRTYHIRFSENDKQIYAVANDYNPTTKIRQNKKIAINAPGYTPQRSSYLAMGDSFASGEGDLSRSYEAGTDTEDNKCHLSTKSYPYLINQAVANGDFHSVACSGAKIENIINSSRGRISTVQIEEELGAQYPDAEHRDYLPGWKAQKSYINSPPSYITLSVGGNDVGFASKLTACVTSDYKVPVPDTCKYANDPKAKANVAKEIANQYESLKKTYQQLKIATDEQTKIYVMGYPQFVEPEGDKCLKNVLLNKEERQFIYKSVHYMNQVIKASATDSGLKYIDIENTLVGSNLCSDQGITQLAVNGLTLGPDKEVKLGGWQKAILGSMPATNTGIVIVDRLSLDNGSYHPNEKAQPLIKNEILKETDNNPAEYSLCPDLQDRKVCPINLAGKIPQPDAGYFGSEATRYVNMKNGDDKTLVSAPPILKKIIQGNSSKNSARVLIEDLLPNSLVVLEKHSTPTNLGTYHANAEGILDITVDLTVDQGIGPHEIHAYTKNIAGASQEYYQHIFITGQEGDVNGNNIPDVQEKCGFVPDSGIDYDQDGVDDACDGLISDPPLPPEPDPIVIPDPTPIEVIQPTDDPNKKPLGESVAGVGDEIISDISIAQTQPGVVASTTISPVGPVQPILAQASEPVALNTNNPQASSGIASSFNNSTSNEKPQKINTADKERNYYMLVLIIPLAILLVTIFKFIKVRHAKEKNN